VYVGVKMFIDKNKLTNEIANEDKSTDYFKIYRTGIITNVLNPKVALFFIAFLPQFIDPALENAIVSFLILGLSFIITGTVWCLLLATFASTLFGRLKDNSSVTAYINKICGLALIGLGIKVALTER
jgi:threonine/homoserine/homoserine lactone efflux protein